MGPASLKIDKTEGIVLDREKATLFRAHMLAAIRELSSAAALTQDNANIKRSIADIIARIDRLLADTIYAHFPELDDLRE